jgi:hypothetical protein
VQASSSRVVKVLTRRQRRRQEQQQQQLRQGQGLPGDNDHDDDREGASSDSSSDVYDMTAYLQQDLAFLDEQSDDDETAAECGVQLEVLRAEGVGEGEGVLLEDAESWVTESDEEGYVSSDDGGDDDKEEEEVEEDGGGRVLGSKGSRDREMEAVLEHAEEVLSGADEAGRRRHRAGPELIAASQQEGTPSPSTSSSSGQQGTQDIAAPSSSPSPAANAAAAAAAAGGGGAGGGGARGSVSAPLAAGNGGRGGNRYGRGACLWGLWSSPGAAALEALDGPWRARVSLRLERQGITDSEVRGVRGGGGEGRGGP